MDNNTASNDSTSPLGSFPRVNGGKRRLCVIALNSFWERIKQDERIKSAVTVERLRERKVKLDNLQQIPIEQFVSGNIDEHNADTRIVISNNSLETCTSSPCEFHGDRQTFSNSKSKLRILVPYRGNIYVQDGIGYHNSVRSPLRLL